MLEEEEQEVPLISLSVGSQVQSRLLQESYSAKNPRWSTSGFLRVAPALLQLTF